jgi:hypothetical protein
MADPRKNHELARSRLPRQRWRRFNRQFKELIRRDGDNCCICRVELKHNSRTFGGLDRQGRDALVGDCCAGQLATVRVTGFFTRRDYDFLPGQSKDASKEYSADQIAAALTAYQKAVADTDRQMADIERRGGGVRARNVNLGDHPWKRDDAAWFERNPKRAHRARAPYPGEADQEAAKAPAGHTMVMLVRQVEPGSRVKTRIYLTANALPVPDNEAVIHARFEIAAGREALPGDVEAFHALVEKYRARET